MSGGQSPFVFAKQRTTQAEEVVSGPAVLWVQHLMEMIRLHKRVTLVTVSAFVVIVGSLAYLFYFPASSKAINSIAVLPLVNAGNDPETEYLSDGITESLINSLSQVNQLRVVPRTTAFRYQGKELDTRQVGRELGVRAVLTGRLRQRGDNLDIQVELVETSTGSQVWGEHYDRRSSDLLAVRQELAREITERLRLRLRGEDEKRLTSGDAGNTEAYGFYLKGRYFWHRRTTAANYKKAIDQFQQALDTDPNYALAYVGLADCYIALEECNVCTSMSETLPKARAAVQRALQIDDSLGEAHASLGAIEMFSWNFSEAEREYTRAIELNPNDPTVYHWYSYYFRLVRGRLDEAMAELRRAQQLDPLWPRISINIAHIFLQKGELDTAIEESKKVLDLDPNYVGAHRVMGFAYRQQGRYDEAIAEMEKEVELTGRGSRDLANLGVCYAVAGKEAKARAILKEIEEKYYRGEALGQNLADLYAALGDKDRAFAWLEKDFKAHSGVLLIIAHNAGRDILRDALSSDPRWNDLLRRIGLPQQ